MNGHIIYPTKFSTDIERFESIIIDHPDLSKKSLRVFMFLCCRLSSKHLTKIDKGQIASSLGISKGDVSDAIDQLVQCDIIVSGIDDHVKNGYRFCYTGDLYDGDD